MIKIIFLPIALCGLFLGNALAADADEMMATFLNMKGKLCAKVVKINKLTQPDTYEVRCIEY